MSGLPTGLPEPLCDRVSGAGNPCERQWGHKGPHVFRYEGMTETWYDPPTRRTIRGSR